MIANRVEESLLLDYKRAAALQRADRKPEEIIKDVSSFANSSGGTIIYGVAEFHDTARQHLPERPDPVQRAEISKEWLEQIIQTIQPRIEGLQVHPVPGDEQANTVCYVVEIPQSDTAHQARDQRYHRRHNFNTLAMEDYEVRDVMNRRKHPKIRGSIHIKRPVNIANHGMILVKLENVGRVLARNVMVELLLPIDLSGPIAVEEPAPMREREDGFCYVVRLTPQPTEAPLFPSSDIMLKRPIHAVGEWRHVSGKPMDSVRDVRVRIFADEMPPIEVALNFAPVILDWTEIQARQ